MAQLHNTGEEWVLKEAFGSGSGATSVSCGLYNTSDALADSDNVDDITTEPSGAGYERQSATLDAEFSFQNNGDNWETIIDDVVFDVDDSSVDVDGYFVTVEFESDEAGDSSPSENLLFTGELDQEYDLNSVTQFTMQGSGISID